MRDRRDFDDHWFLFSYKVKVQSPARPPLRFFATRAFHELDAWARFRRNADPCRFQVLVSDWYETEPLIVNGELTNAPLRYTPLNYYVPAERTAR